MAIATLEWIAVDWGTTALRVWGLDAQDQVIAEARSAAGMASLIPTQFEAALLALIGPWLAGREQPIRIIACGMVGARQGWVEAPYRQIPCPAVDVSQSIPVPCADPRLQVQILPGLCQLPDADVMRGEETQIAGWQLETGAREGVLCLPGTHSKWVDVRDGIIERFITFMTGEHYALLHGQSVLRFSLNEPSSANALDDEAARTAFLDAVASVVAAPASFHTRLFGIRAGQLLNGTTASVLAATLSGMVIGAELAGAEPLWRSSTVTLIGEPALVARYALALQHLGGHSQVASGKTLVLAGLKAAYRHP